MRCRWLPRMVRGCLLGAVTAVAASGCRTEGGDQAPQSCALDADCPSEQRCSHTGQLRQPIPFNPCVTLVTCTDSSACPGDQVCAPYLGTASGPSCPGLVCTAPCQPGGCAPGEACKESGLCELEDCDKDGAPECPAHYECDPSAAAEASTLPLFGSAVGDAADAVREAARGCVRKQCDEPDGFTCREQWSCAPERATNEASGCVPEPCSETGRCSDDGYFICEPMNDGPRPEGTDPQGCRIRNCGEGFDCQYVRQGTNYANCDLESAESDDYGCRIRRCSEPSVTCLQGYACAPSSVVADRVGCRPSYCNEPGGPTCPAGTRCAPRSPGSEVYSCVAESVASGGVGSGSGGAPSGGGISSGGSGGDPGTRGGSTSGGARVTGGASHAGAPQQPVSADGVCVAR
jgi:hypothetical protein